MHAGIKGEKNELRHKSDFEKSYPPAAARYCNQNGFRIVELEPENNIRRFQIQPTPELSVAEKRNLSAAKETLYCKKRTLHK